MKNLNTTAFIPGVNQWTTLALCLVFLCFFRPENTYAQCTNDLTPPTALCKTGVNVDVPSSGVRIVEAALLDAGSIDNCSAAADLQFFIEEGTPSAQPPGAVQLSYTAAQAGPHNVVLWAVDTAGNASFCATTLQVTVCNTVTSLVCNDLVQVALYPDSSYTFTLLPSDILEGGPYCNYSHYTVDIVPYGDPAPSILLGLQDVGTKQVKVTHVETGNACWGNLKVQYLQGHFLRGTVFKDLNDDCVRQVATEGGLENWTVQATGQSSGAVYTGATNALGQYVVIVDPAESNYNVVLIAPFNYGGSNCPTTYTATFSNAVLEEITRDLSVQLDDGCPLLYVDLATPLIRRCSTGYYTVQYANQGANTLFATFVELQLDPALILQSVTLPYTEIGPNHYRVSTGQLDPGESGQFRVDFFTTCNTTAGATLCSEAHIFPDVLCINGNNWGGANIEVEGACVNDSIFLKIKNTGLAPTVQPLDYVVIEDVLLRDKNTFNLDNGKEMTLLPFEGKGATYRLQAQQEPGHPYGGQPAVAVEGCGGLTPGLVTMLPINNANPFIAVFCKQVVASYDPNDKQATPVGYLADHLIEKNTPIDYMVRFQNTGTDTAFNIVILDTLSVLLDAKQARPGAASHPYRFELLGDNVLKFAFENILLPDSNVNVDASQGFIQFYVPQKADNPQGARIENTAAIYFDFNAPVITNQTFHTVKTEFILTVSTDDPVGGALMMDIFPNPAADRVHFRAPGYKGNGLEFTLTDAAGRLLRRESTVQLPYTFERQNLRAGAYFFRFTDEKGQLMRSGKIVIR